MITYPISSNLCKKGSLQCYWLYNCSFFRSSHWRCFVRKRCSWEFCKIHRKTLLIFLVSSLEDFLFISFQQKNEMKKGKYPDGAQTLTFLLQYWFVLRQKNGSTLMELKHLLFCSSIDLFDVKDFKRNLTDGNLTRKFV